MSVEGTKLPRLGRVLIIEFVNVTETGVLWAIHGVLTICALVSLWRRNREQKASKFLFSVMTFILLLSTYNFFFFLARVIQITHVAFVKNPGLPLDARIAAANKSVVAGAQAYFFNFLLGNAGLTTLIGDIVVIWRTWVIWTRSKVYLVVPILLVIVAFVLGLVGHAVQFTHRLHPNAQATNIYTITVLVGIGCGIVANGIATGLIAFQAVKQRSLMKEYIGVRNSRVWRIMLFLTEAGLVYLFIQSLSLILNASDNGSYTPHSYVNMIWLTFSRYVSMAYPAVVILIVSHNRSLSSDTEISKPGGDLGTHISFGRPQMNTSGTVLDSYITHGGELSSPERSEMAEEYNDSGRNVKRVVDVEKGGPMN